MIDDIRLALRSLRRSPGFAAAAILTLGLGIGATSAVFSVMQAVVLDWRGALHEPERLAMLWKREAQYGNWMATPADFRDWRRESTELERMAAFTYRTSSLRADGVTERYQTAVVEPGLFAMLGIAPRTGRAFDPDEATWGNHRVALLSDGLWRSRFGRDPDVIGRGLILDGERHEIVGVMPPGAWFGTRHPRLFVPYAHPDAEAANARNGRWHYAVGRLADGATIDSANTEIAAIAERIADRLPSQTGWSAAVTDFESSMLGRIAPTLRALAGAVGLVLLLAAINVAALMFARFERRRDELAVRAALGADRRRLMSSAIAEGLVLSFLGGALGLAIARFALDIMMLAAPESLPRIGETGVTIDLRVVLFAASVSLVSAVGVALVPALRASGRALGGARRQTRATVGSRAGRRGRSTLMIADVALSALLLVGAGLLLRTLVHLGGVDLGVRPDGLAFLEVEPPEAAIGDDGAGDDPAINAFFDRLERRVRAVPGVRAAGMTSELPLQEGGPGFYLGIEGRADPATLAEVPIIRLVLEGSGSHEALGIELVRGRRFDDRDDAGAENVALIDERLAARFFDGEDPIGKTIRLGAPGHDWLEDTLNSGGPFPRHRIVGVTRDVRYQPFDDLPGAVVYVPFRQRHHETMNWWPSDLAIRADGDPETALASVRAAVRALDPNQPLGRVVTVADLVGAAFRGTRFAARMLLGFAIIALVLATIGIYGVIAYSVARRRREIGLRMALGAERRHIFSLVGGQALACALIGLGLGIAGALAAGRFVESLLRGVEHTDPATLGSVGLTLLAVAVLAAYLPIRRATTVQPNVALRDD